MAIALATVVRFLVAGGFDVPWIAPDEATYGMLGASLWETGSLALRGAEAPFYSLATPALVGLPLAAEWTEGGVRAAQLLQTAAMSLTAVTAFVWARRLVGPWHAAAAAVLVLLLPHLVYGATLMTEPLAFLLVTTALYALARMLERPTVGTQALLMLALTLAAATRLQALLLVPVVVAAAAVDALLARNAATMRRLAPLLVALSVAGLAAAAVSLVGAGSPAGVYSEAGARGVRLLDVPHELLWHASALAIGVGGVALLAAAMLIWAASRQGEPGPAARALLAVTAAYTVLLLAQVSLFAAGHLEAAADRYLLTAFVPLLVCLVLWVERGAPRPRPAAWVAALVLVAVTALAPLDRVASSSSLQDSPGAILVRRLADGLGIGQAAAVAGGVLAAAVFLVVPARRAVLVLPFVGVALFAGAAVASHDLAAFSRKARADDTAGGRLDWVDRAGAGRVTLLDTGDREAASLARAVFWNESVTAAVRFRGATGGLPLLASRGSIRPDGVITVDGRPLAGGDVLAPATLVLDGDEKAAQAPSDAGPGLTLWRAASPTRVVLRLEAFGPNGDFSGKARVRVFGCVRGSLLVTLVGKEGDPIRIVVDGIPLRELDLPPGVSDGVEIPSPPYADGTRDCVFDLESDGLVGRTRVSWRPEA
jgi:hypothetical protein